MDWLEDTPDPLSSDFDLPLVRGDIEPPRPRWTKFGDDNQAEGSQDFKSTYSTPEFQPGLVVETKGHAFDGRPSVSVSVSASVSSSDSADSASTRPAAAVPVQDGSVEPGELAYDPPRHTKGKWNNQLAVCLPQSSLNHPRSRIDGWLPPLQPSRESTALADLMRFARLQGSLSEEDFVEFELDNFSVYVRNYTYHDELRPLQHLATKHSHDTFYFDGVLKIGDVMHYVRGVQFKELPIGNYGTSNATVEDQIWIRSRMNESNETYYRLKHPSAEYARFYTPFLWLADLAKHVVDFCSWMTEKKRPVTLRHFQKKFIDWLLKIHKNSPSFRKWHKEHGSDDYRSSVVSNVEFIWKEVNGVLGLGKANSLQIFREIKHITQYKPTKTLSKSDDIPLTIVTPYAYECFGHMKIGRLLRILHPQDDKDQTPEAPSRETESVDPLALSEQEPEQPDGQPLRKLSSTDHKVMVSTIKPGDTISTPPDDQGTGTKWKREAAKGFVDDNRWFGLVQKVHINRKNGTRSFDVIWLYRPVDTPCCKMKYPWANELFLSDHCTCDEGRGARWDEDEVLGKHTVDWLGNPNTTAEFFVRQTYMVERRRWVTLDPKQRMCNHNTPLPYTRGDTVLASLGGTKLAEPYEVVEMYERHHTHFARLRKLLRRKVVEPQAKNIQPNELVYTERLVVAHVAKILRKCLVRFFSPGEPLPCPYNRGGAANVFFITHKLQTCKEGARKGEEICVPFKGEYPPSMRQAFNPKRRNPKLKGLDLFCGSGNFGRGLEEGGAVNMHWANDIWDKAVHTYMANTPANTCPFLGSVDDLLRDAIEGRYSNSVPSPGEVDFICGGSPCQGFSLLTDDKKCDRQVKNQSLVASFASFVDFYRPKYGILENVPAIVQSNKNRSEDVFSQLICAIVGMGYQAQIILGDAWSYGAPQKRSRVFLCFAAPGNRLPEAPLPSHSHHPGATARSLGLMSNGEPYVRRSFEPTAFKFVSAAEGTADLPEIADGKPDCCVGYPDHRLQAGATPSLHLQYSLIPTHPYGMNFARAWNEGAGVMTASERELFPMHKCGRTASNSKGWGRVYPVDVFPTITTTCGPTDSRTGRLLHWNQNRPISIMEARRAQGFLDHEVVLGAPPEKWKLVGNSVARQIALALGLHLREAWLGSLYDEPTLALPVAHPYEAPLNTVSEEAWGVAEMFAEGCSEIGDSAALSSASSIVESPGSNDEPRVFRTSEWTPPTSASETTEARLLNSNGAKKRPLSYALAVELHASKRRLYETQYEDSLPAAGTTGPD